MNGCTQCEMLSINGIPCHETGCVNAGAIKCAGCNETVQRHKVFTANDWDGIQYCKPCAECAAQYEADCESESFEGE